MELPVKKLLLCLIILCCQSAFSADEVAATNPPNLAEIQAELAELKIPDTTAAAVSPAIEAEKQIPVQLEPAKKAEASSSPIKKAMTGFGIALILALGAIALVKKYRYSNKSKSNINQIKVLTQHYLGPKKSLAIIRVAGESILIGITDSNISMIKSLALLDEDIPEETPTQFDNVLANQEAQQETNAEEEFAISGIKDFVSSKLKNMRSIQ